MSLPSRNLLHAGIRKNKSVRREIRGSGVVHLFTSFFKLVKVEKFQGGDLTMTACSRVTPYTDS